jgi:hypothetical protein
VFCDRRTTTARECSALGTRVSTQRVSSTSQLGQPSSLPNSVPLVSSLVQEHAVFVRTVASRLLQTNEYRPTTGPLLHSPFVDCVLTRLPISRSTFGAIFAPTSKYPIHLITTMGYDSIEPTSISTARAPIRIRPARTISNSDLGSTYHCCRFYLDYQTCAATFKRSSGSPLTTSKS